MLSEEALWRARDLKVLWHPCTQMREHEQDFPLIPIKSGRGAYLQRFNGEQLLDAVSSWWTNLFGHANAQISAAISEQAQQLEHVIFSGFSHAPAIELAEALVAMTPNGLTRVFYGENGSAAVEIALKMSYHAHLNQDQPQRKKFIALQNGYHGETLGALSMTDVPLYRKVYAPLLLQPIFAPSPDAFLASEGETAADCAIRAADSLRDILEANPGEIAALIVEPLVQCAGGMRMYDPEYLRRIRQLCDLHGVHLIADEIAVGFARTGTLFACEQANISPDIMCLSKGLTGGSLPLSAVLTTDSIYRAFWHEDRSKAFLHSHSYSGNPIACSAALAVTRIFQSQDIIGQNRLTAQLMRQAAQPIADFAHIADYRQTGMIAAFELQDGGKRGRAFEHERQRALRAYNRALECGVLLRPLGNVIYWMPPYCVSEHDIEQLARATREAIEAFVE